MLLNVCFKSSFFSVTGFRGWDNESTGIDINEELAQIANKAALGEEGPGGGYFFFLMEMGHT